MCNILKEVASVMLHNTHKVCETEREYESKEYQVLIYSFLFFKLTLGLELGLDLGLELRLG